MGVRQLFTLVSVAFLGFVESLGDPVNVNFGRRFFLPLCSFGFFVVLELLIPLVVGLFFFVALDNVHDIGFGFEELVMEEFGIFFVDGEAVGEGGVGFGVGEFGGLGTFEAMRGGLENIVKVNFHKIFFIKGR